MRLLIIGTMRGPLATAAQIAMARGATMPKASHKAFQLYAYAAPIFSLLIFVIRLMKSPKR